MLILGFVNYHNANPIQVAARSKEWVWGPSLVGIAVSNPDGDVYVCLL